MDPSQEVSGLGANFGGSNRWYLNYGGHFDNFRKLCLARLAKFGPENFVVGHFIWGANFSGHGKKKQHAHQKLKNVHISHEMIDEFRLVNILRIIQIFSFCLLNISQNICYRWLEALELELGPEERWWSPDLAHWVGRGRPSFFCGPPTLQKNPWNFGTRGRGVDNCARNQTTTKNESVQKNWK